MFCRFCGKDLEDTATRCNSCGKPTDAKSPSAKGEGKGWSFGVMLALIVATLFSFGTVGLVAGFLGLRNEHKKVQAAILLTISAFMALMTLAIVLGL
jgi:hypothetical protein